MTEQERDALQTAISIYLQLGVLDRVCQSTDLFLSRVPNINVRRLQTLIKSHSKEIAAMAGAKDIIYHTGTYIASGRGAFGRKSDGNRSSTISPSVEFIFDQ